MTGRRGGGGFSFFQGPYHQLEVHAQVHPRGSRHEAGVDARGGRLHRRGVLEAPQSGKHAGERGEGGWGTGQEGGRPAGTHWMVEHTSACA